MNYENIYRFLKTALIVLSLLIGVKSYAYDYDPALSCQAYDLSSVRTNAYATIDECITAYNAIPSNYIAETACYPFTYVYNSKTYTNYKYDFREKLIVANVYKVCPDDALGTLTSLNTADCSCGCPSSTVFFDPTLTCVPECIGTNMDYTPNGGCACVDGYEIAPDSVCYLTASNPNGDDNNDGIPNYLDPTADNDQDGVQNGNDEDWLKDNPDYNQDQPVTLLCDTLPSLVETSGAGWFKNGSLSTCTTTFQNQTNDGLTLYVSRVDTSTCADSQQCVILVSSCSTGKVFSTVYDGCVDPAANVTCNETMNYNTTENSGKCQKEFLCEDGITVYTTEPVTCPAPGTAEDNATVSLTDQQSVVNALTQYKAATSSKQDEIIKYTQVTNTKLSSINDSLSTIDQTLNKQLTKQDTTNTKLTQINDLLTNQIQDNHNQLNNVVSAINGADTNNLNGLNNIANKLDGISTKLDDLNGSSDQGSVDTTGFDEDMGVLDGLVSEVSTSFSGVESGVNSAISTYNAFDALISNGITVLPHTQVTSCPYTFTKDGKTYTWKLCERASEFSSIIYALVYLIGLFSFTFALISIFNRGGE